MAFMDTLQGLLGQAGRNAFPNRSFGGLLSPQQIDQSRKDAKLATAASLLQASGPSLTPQNPLGNIGQALQVGRNTQRQSGLEELQRQLIQSQLGLNQANTARALTPSSPNAQTTMGKINEDLRSGNISQETASALRQAELQRDAVSISDAETALRKEYDGFSSQPRSALAALENSRNLLEESLDEDGNPIALQAAFTSFIRAIDNSVVRPSEQATYQGVSGIAAGLENRYSQAIGAGTLGATDKKNLLDAINALAEGMEGIVTRTDTFYRGLAESSRLNPDHVVSGVFQFGSGVGFDVPASPAPSAVSGASPTRHIE